MKLVLQLQSLDFVEDQSQLPKMESVKEERSGWKKMEKGKKRGKNEPIEGNQNNLSLIYLLLSPS